MGADKTQCLDCFIDPQLKFDMGTANVEAGVHGFFQ